MSADPHNGGGRFEPGRLQGADAGPKWYAAATKPSRETYARAQLGNQNFEVFLPLARRTLRSGRNLLDREVAFFPGYLFIRLDPARHPWRAVNSTRGIRSLVMAGGVPLPLPPSFVEEMRALTGEDGLVRSGIALAEGDRVRITAGPFTEFIGTLQRTEARGRIRVLIRMLNGDIPALVDKNALAPAA